MSVGWHLIVCISIKLLGDADPSLLGPHFEKQSGWWSYLDKGLVGQKCVMIRHEIKILLFSFAVLITNIIINKLINIKVKAMFYIIYSKIESAEM